MCLVMEFCCCVSPPPPPPLLNLKLAYATTQIGCSRWRHSVWVCTVCLFMELHSMTAHLHIACTKRNGTESTFSLSAIAIGFFFFSRLTLFKQCGHWSGAASAACDLGPLGLHVSVLWGARGQKRLSSPVKLAFRQPSAAFHTGLHC